MLADGQGSGRAAKAISQQVARKTIAELAEGVRDGAAARAAHDFLYTHKGGRVSATLNILSVDLTTGTLVLSRNNPHPAIVVRPDREVGLLDAPSQPVGIYPRTRPVITEVALEPGLAAAATRAAVEYSFYLNGVLLHISRLTVNPNSALAGRRVGEVEQELDLSIILLSDPKGVDFHPPADRVLNPGDQVVVFASLEALACLNRMNGAEGVCPPEERKRPGWLSRLWR